MYIIYFYIFSIFLRSFWFYFHFQYLMCLLLTAYFIAHSHMCTALIDRPTKSNKKTLYQFTHAQAKFIPSKRERKKSDFSFEYSVYIHSPFFFLLYFLSMQCTYHHFGKWNATTKTEKSTRANSNENKMKSYRNV